MPVYGYFWSLILLLAPCSLQRFLVFFAVDMCPTHARCALAIENSPPLPGLKVAMNLPNSYKEHKNTRNKSRCNTFSETDARTMATQIEQRDGARRMSGEDQMMFQDHLHPFVDKVR